MSYSEHFSTKGSAINYEAKQYKSGSYSDVLWQIERTQLESIVMDFRLTHDRIDYLDFASGSGRVLSFLEGKVDSAMGIEISEDMAELAREKLVVSKVICCDITRPDAPVEGIYDLITAFRFLLNAEPSLRSAALNALKRRLRDNTSWLIINNHGNFWSHKIVAYPFHAWRNRGEGHRLWGNYLKHSEVVRLLDAAGLKVRRVVGCGFVSNKITGAMKFENAVALEKLVASRAFLSRFCVNQMYVAQLK